jgi:anaphase-promoting complex subunit 4
MAVALSADGRVLALSEEGGPGVTLWEVASGKLLHRLEKDGYRVEALTFSPDGSLLAAAGKDGAVWLWRAATGRFYRRLPTNAGNIYALAFTPDGRSLITGGKDGRVRLWELFTATQRRELGIHNGNVLGVAVSADGRRVASASADTSVRLYDLAPPRRGEALTEDQLAALWADLTDRDAARADRAAVKLMASPQTAVSFLRERLRPAPVVKDQDLRRLVAALEHRRFAVRQRAERQLEQFGVAVRPALRRALAERPTLETRRRLERLLDAFDEEMLPSTELRAWRAVGLLEMIGTPTARRLLAELAGGAPGAWQTEAARRVLTVRSPALER